MPQFQGKIVSVANNGAPAWQSPDGQRKIWQVTVDVNGKQAPCKTYSQVLSQVGYQGMIETYEKANNRGGIDTFIKQPAQDPQQAAQGRPYSGGGQQSASQQSPYTMYLSYAKDVAVALIGKGVAFSETDLLMELKKIAAGGEFLYDMRPDNPNRKLLEIAQPTSPFVEPDKNELNNLFGATETVDDGNDPWQNNPIQPQ